MRKRATFGILGAVSRRPSQSILFFLLCVPAFSAAPQAPARHPVRVCAGGDVALGSNLDTNWVFARGRRGPLPPALADPLRLIAPIQPLVSDAAVLLVNVEGAIGSGAAPRKCAPRSRLCYTIRQPPAAAAAIRHLNDSAVVVGNLANNHAHDAGHDGFLETLRLLGVAGVLVTGVDTMATPVPVGDGDTIAVLGFSPWSAARVQDLDAVRRHVARAAAQYGRVVVTMHIGAEGAGARHTVDDEEQLAGEDRGNSVAFARAAVDGGASLVVGHGPHVMRGAEWLGPDGRALVAHSLGNLVTYGGFRHAGFTDHGAVLCVTLGADGAVADARLRSTRQRAPGIVEADPRGRGAAEVDELSRQDFPETGVRVLRDGEVVRPKKGAP